MLDIQNTYIDYLLKIESELEKIRIADEVKDGFDFELRRKVIANTELLVPIIGAFSAGKSSLLNSFLGKSYLPVKLTPETALATELRYSEEEYIDAVKADNTIVRFTIDEISKITEISHEFKFLKMFINNQALKDLEPLILVDMPGFESPLDLHNQAIMEYINRGVHYIVLTSIEDGTITRSMVRQLTDIQEYGRDFSFFLSKTNLRAKSEAEDIAINIKEQIEEYFDVDKNIVLIDNDGGKSLQKILSSIDLEQLFENLFIDDLKDNYYNIMEVINTTISSLGKDKNENKEVISELKESLQKLQNERDRLVSEAKERYSNSGVNRIVESVGKKLSDSLDELVASGLSGGQESMSQLASEIIRHALVSSLKDSMNDISNDVVNSFSINLSSLNTSMSDFTMSDNWLEKMTDSTSNMLNSARASLGNIIEDRNSSNNNDKMYKVITTILATTTNVLAPAIELLIVVLPDLLRGLFEGNQQKKQKEQIQNTILTQVIPSLKIELRSKLPEIFNQQVQEMISNISDKFEDTIEEKKQVIEATQKEINEKTIDIEKTIHLYKKVNSDVSTLANNILYK